MFDKRNISGQGCVIFVIKGKSDVPLLCTTFMMMAIVFEATSSD